MAKGELVEIPEEVPEKPKVQRKKSNFFLLFEKKIKYENFLFSSENSESPEIFFCCIFRGSKKCQQKPACQQKQCQQK